MTEGADRDEDASFFAVGTTLVRNRWRIARWMLLGALVASALVFPRPVLYESTASFISQESDQQRSNLANLAGQFGVSVATGSQAVSVDFYVQLLTSRALLEDIVRDTLVVQEMDGQRLTFLDLFQVEGASETRREEAGVALLRGMITASVSRATGVVSVMVDTEFPSVSKALVTGLVDGVNDFNLRRRRVQAAAERRFIEERLAVAATELRQAEGRLQEFLTSNRLIGASVPA